VASITFACGTPMGGAVDSTLALAEQAVVAGHSVRVVVAAGDSYARLPRLTAAMVRLEARSRRAGRLVWKVHDRLSARTDAVDHGSITISRAGDVPAAVGRLHEPGALLVVNSVRRLDLARLLDLAERARSTTVWYLREAASLPAVAEHGAQVDVLLANSRPLAEEASVLSGRTCGYVPSVISRDGLVEPRERRAILTVNPIPSHGVAVVLALARRRPEQRFVLQESWALGEEAVDELLRTIADLPNVELRRRAPRAEVFHDALVLLLPHSGAEVGASRPRVALEAQLLGIPVVGHDISGLAAVAASPELLVPERAPIEAWSDALDDVLARYEELSARARQFAEREMPSAEVVWAEFVRACSAASGGGAWT
jgi:glycosyltransferase involved in cell wall biosynthesis